MTESKKQPDSKKSGISGLEILLIVSILSLVFQLLPFLLGMLIVRGWLRTTFIILNMLALLILIGAKATPNLVEDFQERQKRAKAQKEKTEKARARQEQRLAIERMMESRRRRKF